jgi:hypothetical protein
MSSNRSVDPTTLAGDPFAAQPHQASPDDALLRAAAAAMRLLQDRAQSNTGSLWRPSPTYRATKE